MKIVLFYENLDIFNKINKELNKDFIKYSINEINKLKNITADLLILETKSKNIEKLINKLEILSTIPCIIITDNTSRKYQSIHLLDVINHNEIENINNKIDNCFKKVKQDEFSIFEITDVMQMISMEKKTIALRIISENKIGAIAFKEGLPIYAKAIINKKVEFGIEAAFKVISWDNIKFKLIKVIGEIPVNLKTDLTNLLMGAMQYKDELDYLAKDTKKNTIAKTNINSKLDCKSIINTLKKVTGYVGISIFKENKKLCSDYSNNSNIKNTDLKSHINKITTLVKIMLNDMGFQKFESILLATETNSAIIYHDKDDKLDIILFLEKDSNMALSKIIIKKIMLEIKMA